MTPLPASVSRTPPALRHGASPYVPPVQRNMELENANATLAAANFQLGAQVANLTLNLQNTQAAFQASEEKRQVSEADSQTKFDQLLAMFQQEKERGDRMEQWIRSREAAPAAVSPAQPALQTVPEHVPKPHILKPQDIPKFEGDTKLSQLWLMKMEALYMTSNITDDRQKLTYLIHAMEKTAGRWYQAEAVAGRFVSDSTGEWGTWTGFKTAFLKLFSSELTTEVARTRLDNLIAEKKDSVTPRGLQTFISQYQSLATSVTDRSDTDLRSGFINCMGADIKKFLLTLPVDKLLWQEVVEKSVEFSTRNNTYMGPTQERREKHLSPGAQRWWDTRGGGRQTASSSQAAEPMDLSAITKDNLPKFKTVPPAEVFKHLEAGTCLFCGKTSEKGENHKVSVCRGLLRAEPNHPILTIKPKEGNGQARGTRPPSGRQ